MEHDEKPIDPAVEAGVAAAMEATDPHTNRKRAGDFLMYYVITPMMVLILAVLVYSTTESRIAAAKAATAASVAQQASDQAKTLAACQAQIVSDTNITLKQRSDSNAQAQAAQLSYLNALDNLIRHPRASQAAGMADYIRISDTFKSAQAMNVAFLKAHPFQTTRSC
jgi:hypothetical protein